MNTVSIAHVDRTYESLDRWTKGRLHVVGPEDEALSEAVVAIVGGPTWDAARFDLAPKLKVLARTGIGVDAVDLEEATRRGVLVTNTPEGPTVSTAEHAIALLFAVAKTLPAHQRRLREATGGYAGVSTAVELDGLTIGLLGFGRIARRTARIAAAVGMEVLAHDPYLAASDLVDGPPVRLVDFDGLLAESHVLSLHAPLTEATTGLFSAPILARCRPGAILINAARGGLVDTDALVEALRSGQLAAAGLDVTEPEPLDPDHPLLAMENVVVTPHIASSTVVGRDRMMRMAIEQALLALDGERPNHLVNEAAWSNR